MLLRFQVEENNFALQLIHDGKTIELKAVAERIPATFKSTNVGEQNIEKEKNSKEIVIALAICGVVAFLCIIGFVVVCALWRSKRGAQNLVIIILFLKKICF